MSDLTIAYGVDASNTAEKVYTLLETEHVELLLQRELRSKMNIVLKPNLVVAKVPGEGATTHPQIVEGIVVFLKEHGFPVPVIAEGSWVGAATRHAFKQCGYEALSKRFGLKLLDTKKDKVVRKTVDGISMDICESIANAGFLINLPVLKGHCQTTLTCCLKNLKGCIPDSEKRRYHQIGLHRPIAELNVVVKPQLHLVDAICGDPTFEEGGNPVESNRLLLGTDPVLIDSFCASLLGFETDEIAYLKIAVKHGVGRLFDKNCTVRELFTEHKTDNLGDASERRSRLVTRFREHIDENDACSACFAALICALNNTDIHSLDSLPGSQKIKIGQGFRGKKCSGFGVGTCTAGCEEHVPGCPPSAVDIVRAINER